MTMIKCPECGTEVSDKAEKCLKCAYPIAGQTVAEKVQTIQQTSKGLKKQILFAILVIAIGIVMVTNENSAPSGGFLVVIGIFWFIIIKILIWWDHK